MAVSRTYFHQLFSAITTVATGLQLTWRQLWKSRKANSSVNIRSRSYFEQQEGIATIQYPHVQIPVPEVGRYQLHNEIDDCIVCDKCAKVCPVNCIDIEAVKSPEEFGKTSDGTSKRIYAAKFNIDMAKCCFCGLCTTVCPTECLTMTSTYDFSTFDIRQHEFPFATMTAAEIEASKATWARHELEKAATKVTPTSASDKPVAAKPVFKPRIPPPASNPPTHD
jgi:formate hydrogenlyase subunit 6/NADH:ubiquinone oxidoreductase subunit I